MSKLTERQRLVLTIAVSVVLTGALVALVFSDRNEIKEIEEEIVLIEQRIQAADVEIKRIPQREDSVLVFRAVEDRELAILPTQQKIADFHRNLSTFLMQARIGFKELPESQPEPSELAKGIMATRNKIKGIGDAAAVLTFLNMIENDPRLVAVKGFEIQAGDRRRLALAKADEDKPVSHEFEVELETYYYAPERGNSLRVHIPGAERRLQETGLKEAIAAFQPERPDTYVLRPSASRRDPLVDPRERRTKVDPAELEAQWKEEQEIVDELEASYREIAELAEKEKAHGIAGQLFIQDRIRKEMDKLINALQARIEYVRDGKQVLISDLQVKVQDIQENLDSISGRRPEQDTRVTRDVAEDVLQRMKRHLEDGQYTEITTLASHWTQYLHGKKILAEAKPLIEEVNQLRTTAKKLSEFVAYGYRITGVIVHHTDPYRSLATVNGQRVRVGDVIKDRGGARVERITRREVFFDYKGEIIPVSVSRGGNAKKDRRKGRSSGSAGRPRPKPAFGTKKPSGRLKPPPGK